MDRDSFRPLRRIHRWNQNSACRHRRSQINILWNCLEAARRKSARLGGRLQRTRRPANRGEPIWQDS